MLVKNIAYAVFFAGLLPSVAFGSVAYTPSRPCDCINNDCGQTYQDVLWGYQQNASDNYVDDTEIRDFRQGQSQNEDAFDLNDWFNFDIDGYLSANLTMNMLSWKNSYKSNYAGVDLAFEADKYSFERVMGGSLAVGAIFDGDLRADLEIGLSSEFKDENEFATYTLSVPYAMANFYRDLKSGLYFGVGVGVARPETNLELRLPTGIARSSKESWTPKVGVLLGYALKINDSISLDARYRLSGYKGTKMSGVFLWDQEHGFIEEYDLFVNSDYIIENTVSVGLRYRF